MTGQEHKDAPYDITRLERSRQEVINRLTFSVAEDMRTTLSSLADILEQAVVLLRGAAETNIGAELDTAAAAVRTADQLIDEHRETMAHNAAETEKGKGGLSHV